MTQVSTPEWKTYSRQVLDNCKTLAQELQSQGFLLVTGGSDNHLLLIDLKPQGLTGETITLSLYPRKNARPRANRYSVEPLGSADVKAHSNKASDGSCSEQG